MNRKVWGNALVLIISFVSVLLFTYLHSDLDLAPIILFVVLCSYTPLAWVNSWLVVLGPVDLTPGKHDELRFFGFIFCSLVMLLMPFLYGIDALPK